MKRNKLNRSLLKLAILLFFLMECIINRDNGHLQAQSFKPTTFTPKFRVTYQFNFKPDTTNNLDFISKKMYLFICDTVSIFLNADKFVYDSILSNEQSFKGFDLNNPDFLQKSQQLISNLPKVKDNLIIIKHFNDKSIKVVDLVGMDYCFYEEEKEIFDWKIDVGTSLFNDLLCNKAKLYFRGRNYEVLFSSDLGISDGPYKFSALPGLIVHLIDDRKEVEYKISAIEKYQFNMSVIGAESNIKISRQKMKDLKLAYFLNPYALAEANLKNFSIDDRQKAAVIESRKKILTKRGNKIEKE